MLAAELSANVPDYVGNEVSTYLAWIVADDSTRDTAHFCDTMMKYHHLMGDVEEVNKYRDLVRGKINVGETNQKEKLDELFTYAQERTKGREDEYSLANRSLRI